MIQKMKSAAGEMQGKSELSKKIKVYADGRMRIISKI
jgi:hypothetical protein